MPKDGGAARFLPCASAAVWDARVSRRIPWVQKNWRIPGAALKIRKDSGAKCARRGIEVFVSEDKQPGQPQQGQGGGPESCRFPAPACSGK